MHGWVLRFVYHGKASIAVWFVIGVMLPLSLAAQPGAIRTPMPALLESWINATTGADSTLDDAFKAAGAARSTLPSRDPFTRLAEMTCSNRLADQERVVWEDAGLMALADFGDRGSKLLVVPKRPANFLIDLKYKEIAYVSRVAAAACDALMGAAGKQASATAPSCDIYIHPPAQLGVRQLHVHVKARTGVAAPVDDTFLQRAGANLRSLLGGAGCL
jgi:hypothetical protein